jgi:hypothetical protein
VSGAGGDGGTPSLPADERTALIAAHERQVEALRNSPQYRVGELVIAAFRSPARMLRLPAELWRLRKALLAENRAAPPLQAATVRRRDVVVAAVLDDTSADALDPEWIQHRFTTPPTAEQLAAIDPALLFVATGAAGSALPAESRGGVPLAIWDNGASADLDAVAAPGRRADWVFTLDPDAVAPLAALCGHERVAALPFAARPLEHNPVVGARAGETRACVTDIADAALPATRLPRDLFEALACRTPVVTTRPASSTALLGGGVVSVASAADVPAAVECLAGDTAHRDRVGHLGYRAVMSHHTYGDRVDEVLARVGITARPPAPRVTVLAPTNRPEYLDRLLANFSRQRDVDADLIVLTNSECFDREAVDHRVGAVAGARALHLAEGLTMGECLNAGLAATDARFVGKFDDDDHYGEHFLHDSLLVHRFVDAAIVGKKTFYAYLEASDETVLRFPGHEFTAANRVSGSTMVIDRDLFGDVRFGALNLGEDIDLCARALAQGLTVFSADRYNYVAVRRADAASHSWTIGADEYRQGSVPVADGLALATTML